MKRRTFLKNLSLAGAIPIAAGLGCASTSSSGKAQARRLRILSCNIRVDVSDDTLTGNGWAQRRDLCADVIQSRRADLIGFQEVQEAHLSYLKSRMPEFETFALYNPGKPLYPANAIFFARKRFALVSAGGFWLSETPHIAGSQSWDSARPRFVNWVELQERPTGKPLRFWNTHLDHLGQKARENGADMIAQAIEPFAKDLPQLLTGDMNAGFDNKAIQRLKESGWIDTYGAVHGPQDPGFTGHAFKGVDAPDKRANGTPKPRIDWIFYRGPLKPIAASIIRDSRNGRYPSDHFFVSADLEF